MTRQAAVDYIKKTRSLGFSDSALRRELEKSGWPANEIDLAFIESRATDQKPAVESPPTQFAPRTQPQWEEQNTKTFNTEPKPIDLTKSSFATPQEIKQPSKPSTPLGAPTGTIDSIKPVVKSIKDIQKPIITPSNELPEPQHLKELPVLGTPDAVKKAPLETKLSEAKKLATEPMIMGVPESQLIKPVARVEPPKPIVPPSFKPMQEKIVTDLVGGGLASAGAGQSVANSPILSAIGVPPRAKNRRMLAGVLAVAFFFIASGAAAGFWHYQTNIKPKLTVKNALASISSMKSYRYDAQLQIKARESKSTLGMVARQFVSPLAGFALGAMAVGDDTPDGGKSYSLTIRAKGAIDAHDPSKPKSETTLAISTKDLVSPGLPDSNTEFESRIVDGIYYFQVAKLPYFDSTMIDLTSPKFTSADITGRWVSVNPSTFEKDFNHYIKELSSLEPSFIGYAFDSQDAKDLIADKRTQDIQKIWNDTRLIVWSDQIVREQENGADRYRVKGTFDKDSLMRFITKSIKIAGQPEGKVDESDIEDIKKLFAQIGDIEINAWVDKASGHLARFSINAASPMPDSIGKNGVIEINFATDLSDIDQSMTISAPADHNDVRYLLEKLFAYARDGFASDSVDTRDSQRISDLSRVRFALDSYKKDDDTYPEKLSDLVPKYIAALPVDPVTKKQYRYTRKANGYILSAQLENKKHPALGRDISPANTLYDIGPAL